MFDISRPPGETLPGGGLAQHWGDRINVFAVVSLLGSIIGLTVSAFIYALDRESRAHRLFSLTAVSFACWSFVEFMLRQSHTFEQASLWLGIGQIVWVVPLMIWLHFSFAYAYPHRPFRTLHRAAIYLPGAALSVLAILGYPVAESPTHTEVAGFAYNLDGDPYVLTSAFIWSLGALLLATFLGVRTLWHTEKRSRRLFRIGLAGAVIPPLSLAMVYSGLSASAAVPVATVTTVTAAWITVLFGLTIWRRREFEVGPAMAADEILTTMSDALILADAEGRIVRTNPAARRMLGFDESAGLGEPARDALHTAPGSRLLPSDPFIDRKPLRNQELTIEDAGGNLVPVIISTTPIWRRRKSDRHPAGGVSAGTVCLIKDISDLKRSEDKLRKSESRYREMFHSAPTPIIEVDVAPYLDGAGDGTPEGRPRLLEALRHRARLAATIELRSLLSHVNEAAVALFEAGSAKELIDSFDTVIAGTEGEVFDKIAEALAQGRSSFTLDVQTKSLKGTGLSLIASVTATHIEECSERYLIGLSNVTKMKEADETLRRHHADIIHAYSSVLDAVTSGELIFVAREELAPFIGFPISNAVEVDKLEDVPATRSRLTTEVERFVRCFKKHDELEIALAEAVANGVKHGNRCTVQLHVAENHETGHARLQARVADEGPGISFEDLPKATLTPGFSTKPSLGMGFTMMRESCDRVVLATDDMGSELLLEFDWPSEAGATDGALHTAIPEDSFDFIRADVANELFRISDSA